MCLSISTSLLSIAPLIVTNWWFQPLWKIWKSDWIIIPNLVGEVIKFMFQSPPTRLIVSYYPPVNYHRCGGNSTISRSYCSREKKPWVFPHLKFYVYRRQFHGFVVVSWCVRCLWLGCRKIACWIDLDNYSTILTPTCLQHAWSEKSMTHAMEMMETEGLTVWPSK
jgi:hypothetical protein